MPNSSKAPSWTKKEIELLEKVWTSTTPFVTLQEIRERYLPHRTENAIANKASRLKFRRGSTKVGEKRKRQEASNNETPQKKAAKKSPIKIKSSNTNKEKESSKAATTQPIVASSNGHDGVILENGSIGENSPTMNGRLRPPIGTNTPQKGILPPIRTPLVDTNEPRTKAPADQVEENVKSTWKDWLQDPDTILNMKALGMGCFLVFCLRYIVPQLEQAVYS